LRCESWSRSFEELKVKSPDIRIRRYRADDVEAVYEAVTESFAEISRYMGWCAPTYSRDNAATWVTSRAAAWQSKSEYSFLIEDKTGRVLGACGLNRIEPQSGTANLGYWVRTTATGRGVCTAAVSQLRAFAFQEAGLFRLEIVAAVTNIPSQRVAEKSGGVREGILRGRLLANGVRQDAILYSILHCDGPASCEHEQRR
jgi:RimJ/RimL family protein N-acetyltransferase